MTRDQFRDRLHRLLRDGVDANLGVEWIQSELEQEGQLLELEDTRDADDRDLASLNAIGD